MLKNFLIIFIFLFTSCSSDKKLTPKKYASYLKITPSYIQEENRLLQILNDFRTHDQNCSQAAPKLFLHKKLSIAALMHAKDMALNHFVRHDGSGTESDLAKKKIGIGSRFNERILFFGFKAPKNTLCGENVCKVVDNNFTSIEENFKKALKVISNSKEQCQILMNPKFRFVGIGYFKNNNTYYWTLDYAQKEIENENDK